MYEILISNEAEKYYKKLDKDTKKRINRCIDVMSNAPYYGSNIKRLHGELKDKFRYKIGLLRVIYEIHEEDKTIRIIAINSRGDIYKK